MADPKPRIRGKPGAKPEVMEIASIQRDINRWTYGGVLENLDETLRTRGRGKGLAIYDELERDAHCYAELQKRKLAVVARPWQVDSASDAAIDKDAADLLKRQFDEIGKVAEDESQLITGFDQTTINFLDATLKGYAVGEVMWEIRGAEVWASRVLPRDQRRFVFDEGSRLRLLTRENLMLGEELPPRKFVVHRFGAKDGSPYGKGLGHILFWPVFFKRQDISFWLVFADKFGSPTAIGKYPVGASPDDQKNLLATLKAIAQDAGIIIPDGMVIEFLEAARTGSIDTYEKLARYMDEQISKAVLGGTITSTAQSTGLGSGVADTQNDVRIEIARADADLLSDTLNATLVRWIVDYNLPGAGYPRMWRDFQEDAGEINTFTTGLQRLVQMGLQVPKRWAYERFVIPQPVDGEEILEQVAGGLESFGGAAFAERAADDVPTPADLIAARAAREGASAVADWIATIETMLAKAGSLEEFRAMLIAAFGELPDDKLATVLAGAMTAAEAAGRFDAERGGGR